MIKLNKIILTLLFLSDLILLSHISSKQQNKKQRSARVITVTSGKGGVGKSNVSVNLAIQMSRLGKRAVILDADFGLANIEVMLGMRPQYNLADMMFRGKDVKDIICTGPEDIGFISGGSGLREMTNLNKDQILSLVRTMYELDHYADVVISDRAGCFQLRGAFSGNTGTDFDHGCLCTFKDASSS